MRVFIFAQHFAPESVSGAVLATGLASELVSRGHRVGFVTAAPSYPQGRVFTGYRNRWLFKENLNGVTVWRTWSYLSPVKSFWRRMLNYGTFSLGAFFAGLVAALASGRPHVVFSYSPPLPLGVSAWLLSRICRVPWILRLEDLYPDAAIAANVLRNRHAIAFFYRLEKFLYRKATHISVISEGFQQRLLEKGLPRQKISVIPVWADPEEVQPLPKDNRFRKRHASQGEFLLLYAGNLGYNTSLEDVLQAATALPKPAQARFLIVGDGVKKAGLQLKARLLGLSNVTFLPYQPRDVLPEMMAAADLSLVTLNRASYWTSLPSKVFTIMASGRPVLAITPEDSEVAHLVRKHDCGVVVPPGDPDKLVAAIQTLIASPEELSRLGENGRRSLEREYSKQNCLPVFERLLVAHAMDR